MITYATEDEPDTITVHPHDGAEAHVLVWPTRIPGLAVTHKSDCGHTPETWGQCFAVLPPAYGDPLAMCFPLKICAAAFATFIDEVAPWATGDAAEIESAIRTADWGPLWEGGVTLGGQRHSH